MNKRERVSVENASNFLLRVALCLRDYARHLPENAELDGSQVNLFKSACNLEDEAKAYSSLLDELVYLKKAD